MLEQGPVYQIPGHLVPIEYAAPQNAELAQSELLEGLAFQKKWDWEARKRIVPGEVLAASTATPQERDFLLGRTDVDPNPEGVIRYTQLVASEELVEVPEDINIYQSVLPDLRFVFREKGPLKQEILDTFFIRPMQPMNSAQAGSLERQIQFKQRVIEATILASSFRGSDLSWTEWEALEGISYEDGSRIYDPHPEHLPTYRKLVPKAPEPEIPVYDS